MTPQLTGGIQPLGLRLHPQAKQVLLGPQTGGTGGTLGSRYLMRTIDQRFFPRLWEVRSRFFGGA